MSIRRKLPREKFRKALGFESLEERAMLSVDAWVQPLGMEAAATGGAGGQYVEADSSGSVYLAATVNSSATSWDILLRKYSADGTPDGWTKQLQATGSDAVWDVAIDPSGSHLYVAGYYGDVNPFNPLETSAGISDIYLAKVSTADGTVEWHQTWGAAGSDSVGGVAVYGNDVYLTGTFRNEVDFGGTVLTGDDSGSVFVLKVDSSNGSVVWANQSTGIAYSSGISVSPSSVPDVVDVSISGSFSGQTQFGSTTMTSSGGCTGSGNCPRDAFVAQLQDDGASSSFTWARHVDAVGNAKDLVSSNGDLYVSGNLSGDGQVDLGGGNVFTVVDDDAYLLRLRGSDGETIWAKQISGAGSESLEAITVDAASNTAYVSGRFADVADFGDGKILTSYGGGDGFIARYDMNTGDVLAAQRMGGSKHDRGVGIAFRNGSLYAAGRANSTDAAFPVPLAGGGTSAFWSTSVNLEAYTMKMDPAAPIVNITAPGGGSEIDEGTEVTFAGSTTAGTVNWTSSIDGPLGSGSTVTSILTPGRHLVTASATDAGRTGYAGTIAFVKPADSPGDLPKVLKDAKGKTDGVTTSTLTIPQSKTIQDLDVFLSIDHTRTADLNITLISPDGTRVELISDIGGSDFQQLYLDDEGVRSITSLTSRPLSGRFQPEVPGALSAFDGQDALGTWTLEVRDDVRGNTGTLNDWWLIIDGQIQSGITVLANDLQTTEDGGFDTFAIVLDTEPTAEVTVGVSSDDSSEGTVSTISLTFTPANWDTPQTVTVTGVDDTDVDGDTVYTIVTSLTSSSDPDYNGLVVEDIAAINLDNDSNPSDANVIYVSGISFDSRPRGRNNTDWQVIVDIRHDSNFNGAADVLDDSIAGVEVTVVFTAANGTVYNLTGTTDSSGVFRSNWIKGLGSGDHRAEVTDLIFADFLWDPDDTLDPTVVEETLQI